MATEEMMSTQIRSMQVYQLVMHAGPQTGKVYPLDKREITIGRDGTCDLVVEDKEISRRHARISQKQGMYIVEDLGSTNGTFIDGNRLSEAHTLLPGEIVYLGPHVAFLFKAIQVEALQTIITPAKAQPQSNPYIGPRSFQTGERIYGRDREANQLVNLLIAERIVLLHSPSGAGKTSLVQAAVIPRLERMKFTVLPVVRVNLNAGDALAGNCQCNRYVFSALLSLEEDRPAEERVPVDKLAQMSLADYLKQRPRPEGSQNIDVLLFDQFEEILTLDPTDQDAKHEFFCQVGEALGEPRRWALFSMREDYVAALDPYLLWIPGHFSSTFRLDLLGLQAACQAIQEPARGAGVEFEDTAADKLINDLRRVRVQQPDGSVAPQDGPYIEPVQLQVVCYRLWDTPRQDVTRITVADLTDFGEVEQSLVDQSLQEYYSQRVALAATDTNASQRAIREWFDRKLITEQKVRGTVLMGVESSEGLPNETIRSLIDAHLVRGEKRGGSTWFELAHDRLIAPVVADNLEWFKNNLSLLQRRAGQWSRQGQPDHMLLRGQELAQAKIWAAGHTGELLAAEKGLLEASAREETRARRVKQLNRAISVLGILAVILAMVAFSAMRRANNNARSAELSASVAETANALSAENLKVAQAKGTESAQNLSAAQAAGTQAAIALAQSEKSGRKAHSEEVAALSQVVYDRFPLRGILLALESIGITVRAGEPRQPAAEKALRAALGDSHGLPLMGHTASVSAVSFSPDGHWLATGGQDGSIMLWDLSDSESLAKPQALSGQTETVNQAAFSPDGRWLAAAGKSGGVVIWDMSGGAPGETITLDAGMDEILAMQFSPDGNWLAAGDKNGKAVVWDVSASVPGEPVTLEGHTDKILVVAFSQDNRWLATGSQDETIRLWDLVETDLSFPMGILKGHTKEILSLAFSPDGRWLASGSADKTILAWDVGNHNYITPMKVEGSESDILTLAFSPDGRWLAAGTKEHRVLIWNWAEFPDFNWTWWVLTDHLNDVLSLSFSPDGRWLATASKDRTIRLWETEQFDTGDVTLTPVVLRGHEDDVLAVAFNPDSSLLATGSLDGSARLWEMNAVDPVVQPQLLYRHSNDILALDYSPDGRWLATGSQDETIGLMEFNTEEHIQYTSRLYGHEKDVLALAFDRQSSRLASGDKDGAVMVWDLIPASVDEDPLILKGHEDDVVTLAFTPDGRGVVSGSLDGTIRLWDLESSDSSADPQVFTNENGAIYKLAFSQDGKWLAAGGEKGVAYLWDWSDNPQQIAFDKPAMLTGHTDDILALDFSPDSHWLATAGKDDKAMLWDMSSSDPAADKPMDLSGHTGSILTLAFSPDDHWLATSSEDSTARLWDLTSPDVTTSVATLRGFEDNFLALAFSPDGSWLAAGSKDHNIWVWQIDAAGVISDPMTLFGHVNDVRVLAFSPDGQWLASGSKDRSVRLWVTQIDPLIEVICERVGRNLSQVEWQQFFPGEDYRKTCPQWPDGK